MIFSYSDCDISVIAAPESTRSLASTPSTTAGTKAEIPLPVPTSLLHNVIWTGVWPVDPVPLSFPVADTDGGGSLS